MKTLSKTRPLHGAFFFFFMVLLVSCGSTGRKPEGDRRLSLKERPDFLKPFDQHKDVEYFEKVKGKGKVVTYEVKYEDEKDQEISLTFTEKGKFFEREEDIQYKSLPESLRNSIHCYVQTHYPKAKIREVEKREDEHKQNYIDVEIRHDSSPSGYWELSFTEDGSFVSREVENHETLNTLN